MREPILPYMAPNLVELPHSIFLDLANELLPMMNLIVEFHPVYTDRDHAKMVKKLFSAITHKTDIEYQLAEFATQVMEEFFIPYSQHVRPISRDKLDAVTRMLIQSGRSVFDKINGMSGYVYDVFPYTVVDVQFNCEILLRNTMQLNNYIEMNHKPFLFSL